MQDSEQQLFFLTKEKIIKHQKRQFQKILKDSPLHKIDKKTIEFIIEYFQGKHNPKVATRSFIFFGTPGVGKTYLAEKLLQILDVEILYMSCSPFTFLQGTRCSRFCDVLTKANNKKKQVLFFDDLEYHLGKKDEDGSYQPNGIKTFLGILDIVKQNQNKLLIITMNHLHELDERMIDRLEAKIYFDLPSQENKQRFLDIHFNNILSAPMRRFISQNSIGYNYRDLPEVIKLAYRLGESTVTMASLRFALQYYRPTQLYGFTVLNAVDTRLRDIHGKPDALRVARRILQIYTQRNLKETLGLRRYNLLLFHGPPGTGKSFMARALAGELGFPIISINGDDIHGHHPFASIKYVVEMAKRYKNCIIFIDEAEKLLGNQNYEADNPLLGELHQGIDGIDPREIQSIMILAVNDISRFSDTLLDRFIPLRFDCPDYEERLLFFKEKLDHVKPVVKITECCEELARRTEKMTYRMMDRFWNELVLSSLENTRESLEQMVIRITKHHGERCPPQSMFG
ncbi:MAG: ATP-binding protein [Candidatus Thermoplasmatota archaeon]|nr:ATP-binding protein [Candidatus Thermoplasmatota archaeon]